MGGGDGLLQSKDERKRSHKAGKKKGFHISGRPQGPSIGKGISWSGGAYKTPPILARDHGNRKKDSVSGDLLFSIYCITLKLEKGLRGIDKPGGKAETREGTSLFKRGKSSRATKEKNAQQPDGPKKLEGKVKKKGL